jgi:cytochrome c553
MNYFISIIAAMVLLGCSGDKPAQESTKVSANSTHAAAKTVVEKEPAETGKTIAPQLARKTETAVVYPTALYKKCAACHGANAEKPALGKSKVIAGWDTAQTEAALKGYKDGSYGGSMKALMQTQVKTLSDEDIKALAKFINKL